ncbi:MAG: DUF3794 domain-containing protein [Syntrophomonas sp.]|nr:DUF3794 domain-containing protein [Syntrophomonas sp.]
MNCQCMIDNPIEIIPPCNPGSITFDTSADPRDRNWTEIAIYELLNIPPSKPDVESIEKVFINVKIISRRLIDTPSRTTDLNNWEGTRLTGKKLILEGVISEKIVYTAAVASQSVHSAQYKIPFSAFIVMPADVDPLGEFCVDICVEDVFVKALSPRQVFSNVTIFLRAREAQ